MDDSIEGLRLLIRQSVQEELAEQREARNGAGPGSADEGEAQRVRAEGVIWVLHVHGGRQGRRYYGCFALSFTVANGLAGDGGTLGVMPGPSLVENLGLRLIGSEPQAGEEAGSREVEAMAECRTTTVGGQGVGALSRTTDVGGQVVGAPSRTTTVGGQVVGAPSRTTTVGGQVVGAQKVDDEVDAGTSFVLSDGLPPVPAKLVRKIVRGEFVDMAELLRDNLEADRRDAGTLSSEGGGVRRTGSRREVPDLLSWVQCFGVYIGVVASRQPEKVKQLLAYQTLIIREARRLGGRGWLAYDSMFRQQAAVLQSTDWSKLNSTLYAVTFLAQQGGEGAVVCLLSGVGPCRGGLLVGAKTAVVGREA
eukprot:Em0006g1252a